MKKLKDKIIDEIVSKKIDCHCCKLSFLCGLILSKTEFSVVDKQLCPILKFDCDKVCKFSKELLVSGFGDSFSEIINFDQTELRLGKESSKRILESLNIQNGNSVNFDLDANIFACENCAKSFVKAMFLMCGNTNIKLGENMQATSGRGYRISFSLNKIDILENLSQILAENDIDVKIVLGKYPTLIVSDFESVKSLLYLLDAQQSILLIENLAVEREMRSKITREVNATENNIKKTLKSSENLYLICCEIDKIVGISNLPNELFELAQLILKKENLTLNEIAMRLGGNITKSGVNHRVRKIRQIYDNLLK